MNTPVILFVFNRPELTSRVIARIRDAQPSTLLVVCDGPRFGNEDDNNKIAAIREIITHCVDWLCEVQCNFASINLGCRKRVVSGLNWGFSLVEEAVILEDDCLPEPSFFIFAEEMLARYRNNGRVFHIGGNNFTGDSFPIGNSYAFSRYGHIWGWATWRRAWKMYVWDLKSWNDISTRQELLSSLNLSDERGYWGSIFDRCAKMPTEQTTWDYQWTFACWRNKGLAVYPSVHLVENIGQGKSATHTFDINPIFARSPEQLTFPLRHPALVAADVRLDREIFRTVFMAERAWPKKVWLALRRRLSLFFSGCTPPNQNVV